MKPGKHRALNKENAVDALLDQAEKLNAGVRAKVEHPFRIIKRQFGFVKFRRMKIAAGLTRCCGELFRPSFDQSSGKAEVQYQPRQHAC